MKKNSEAIELIFLFLMMMVIIATMIVGCDGYMTMKESENRSDKMEESSAGNTDDLKFNYVWVTDCIKTDTNEEEEPTPLITEDTTNAEITIPKETETVETTTAIPEPSNPDELESFVSIGEFRLTAYCPCVKCCGKWAENRPVDKNGNEIIYTASGNIAKQGYTVGADTSVLPFGTIIYIDGNAYEVQDTGSAVNGKSIDVYFANHEEALNFGLKYKEVFIKEAISK